MKVTVDDDLCSGFSVCVGLCPEVFAIDDDEGFARVLVDEVPEQHRDIVREAALRCPVAAITIDESEPAGRSDQADAPAGHEGAADGCC